MGQVIVFVGTYTRGKPREAGPSKGIYAYRLDTETGKLEAAGVTEGIANPSFLTTDPVSLPYRTAYQRDLPAKP